MVNFTLTKLYLSFNGSNLKLIGGVRVRTKVISEDPAVGETAGGFSGKSDAVGDLPGARLGLSVVAGIGIRVPKYE